jgi:hypothetical protein
LTIVSGVKVSPTTPRIPEILTINAMKNSFNFSDNLHRKAWRSKMQAACAVRSLFLEQGGAMKAAF